MEPIKITMTFGLLICNFIAFGQESKRSHLTKNQAKEILEKSLTDSTLHNAIGTTPILNEKDEVVSFAESVLFQQYDKNAIEIQKPYDVFQIDKYWLVSGTLPKGKLGGTFKVIIDSHNYQVIRLTHGK